MKRISNLTYGLLNTIQNAIFPIITLPYVLKVIGPELYGENLHASLFYQLFSFLFVLSINPYALRELNHALHISSDVESGVYHRLVSMQWVMSIFAGALNLIVIFILGLTSGLYIFYSCLTFLSFMNVEWFFQARQEYKVVFYRTLFVRLMVLLSLFIFVKDENDFLEYVTITALGLIFPSLISFFLANQRYSTKFVFLNVRHDLFAAKHFYCNGAIGSIYRYLDQVIIGMLVVSSELAMVNLIKTISSIGMSIPVMVNKFIIPEAFKAAKNDRLLQHHKKYFFMMMICLLIGSFLFYLFGDELLNHFLGARLIFQPIHLFMVILAVVSSSLSVYIDNQCSVILGLEKITSVSNSVVAVTGPLLVIALFPYWGYMSPLLGFPLGELFGVAVMIFLHVCIYRSNFVRYVKSV